MTEVIENIGKEAEAENELLIRMLKHRLLPTSTAHHFSIESILRKGSNDRETLERLKDKRFVYSPSRERVQLTQRGFAYALWLRKRQKIQSLGYK